MDRLSRLVSLISVLMVVCRNGWFMSTTVSINTVLLILSHVSFRLVVQPVPLMPSCAIAFAMSMGFTRLASLAVCGDFIFHAYLPDVPVNDD